MSGIRLKNLRRRPYRSKPWVNVMRSELDALLDAVEAAHGTRQLVADAIAATPILDANRDAHLILEEARQSLNGVLAPLDFGERKGGVMWK